MALTVEMEGRIIGESKVGTDGKGVWGCGGHFDDAMLDEYLRTDTDYAIC